MSVRRPKKRCDKVTVTVRELRRQAAQEELSAKPLAETRTHPRPRTRADCVRAARPCPFVGCRHHLFLDVLESGAIRLWGEGTIDALCQMEHTCALDVADEDPERKSYDVLGRLLRVTSVACRLTTDNACTKLGEMLAEEVL